MTGDILQAVISECLAFMQAQSLQGTVLLKTKFASGKMDSYSMPLILLDVLDGPDSSQWVGGATKVDWVFAMNIYSQEGDGYVDETTGVATGLMDIVDGLRQHFTTGLSQNGWLNSTSPTMTDLLNNYGFRFTLSGISNSDPLIEDGTIMGYRIMFDSVAIDQSTSAALESSSTLTTVEQIDNPPFD